MLASRSREKLKKVAIKCRKLGCEVGRLCSVVFVFGFPHNKFASVGNARQQVAITPTDVSKPKQCRYDRGSLKKGIHLVLTVHRSCVPCIHDRTGRACIRFLIKEAVRIFGGLDYLVLNAGVSMHMLFEELKVVFLLGGYASMLSERVCRIWRYSTN